MTEGSVASGRSAADQDRFYVQLDKHPMFQAWGKDDETSALPTLKDAFVFAACVGWARERRVPLAKRQHVGFWRSFDTRDATLLHAIAIAETGDPGVLSDQGEIIKIAEEYANGGIDLLLSYDRADKDRTLVALAGLISEIQPRPLEERRPQQPGVVEEVVEEEPTVAPLTGALEEEQA